ncbi:MAG TPA: putative addiction module antidote protein [Ignavibacteria bacterium]|nr:putative addiction module antidote protein [Ignavibacteria bacterium]
MSKKLTKFDVADYLDNESVIAEYLTAILETGDTSLLISSIGDIAKAKGMGQIAVKSGLGRESLYKALKSDSQPRFETILKVLDSLDIKIKFEEKYVT